MTAETIVTVAKASTEDALAIIKFLNEVAGETDFLTFGLNQFNYTLEAEQKIISECLVDGFNLMLVAKLENKIIGQLFLQRSKKERLCHIGDIGISVSRKHWGKFVGRKMMSHAIEWAQTNGVTKLQLQVRSDNNRALMLYKKLGFVTEGKISRAMRINNIYYDGLILSLNF